ncbi:MAG: hypothetical protein SV760_07135, partial [Halobacteria archaeon]|nr:hypothetical protein [Halobacteria archaeon]
MGVVLLSVGLFVLSTSGTLAADTGGKKVTVPANATIFAAGQSEPPDFGGTVPPSVSLSTAESVTFPNITGKVVAGSSFPETGPGGYTRGEIGERELGT